jgi:hypothetical protein
MLKYAEVIKNPYGGYRMEFNDNPFYIFVSFLVYKALEYNYEFLIAWLQGKYKQSYVNDNMFILIKQNDQVIVYFECDAKDKDEGKDYSSIPHFKESSSFFIQAMRDFIKFNNFYPNIDGILITQELGYINIAPLKVTQIHHNGNNLA